MTKLELIVNFEEEWLGLFISFHFPAFHSIFYTKLSGFYKGFPFQSGLVGYSFFCFVSVFLRRNRISIFLKPSDTLNKPRRTGVYIESAALGATLIGFKSALVQRLSKI